MSILKFSDGTEFDLSGPIKKEKREDGWYVYGNNIMIPMDNEDDCDIYLKIHKDA